MRSPCCARAASDQLTAAPLKMVMNSRRLICLPRGSRQAIVLAQTSTLKGGGYAFRRRSANVRFGSKADSCSAATHVRFTPNSDRESGHPQEFMSALPPCVDGSELARTFLNVCSIGRCSHVFGLFARFT